MKRKCGCGRPHIEIPILARYFDDGTPFSGWYWECVCGSTMFFPKEKL